MLLWVCLLTDHRKCQNVVKTSCDMLFCALFDTILFLPHFEFVYGRV